MNETYIVIPEDFFKTETMKGLRLEDNGAEATVIYLKLALMQKSCENQIATTDGIAALAEKLDEDPDTFEEALLTLADYELAEAGINGDYVYIKVTMPYEVE